MEYQSAAAAATRDLQRMLDQLSHRHPQLPRLAITGIFDEPTLEAVMIFLAEKFRLPYGPTRIAMDCTWGVLGFFLGGTLGVGTLIGAFGIGASLDLCYRALKPLAKGRVPEGK